MDEIARESYEATWLDLLMETRPEYKYALYLALPEWCISDILKSFLYKQFL